MCGTVTQAGCQTQILFRDLNYAESNQHQFQCSFFQYLAEAKGYPPLQSYAVKSRIELSRHHGLKEVRVEETCGFERFELCKVKSPPFRMIIFLSWSYDMGLFSLRLALGFKQHLLLQLSKQCAKEH